ncbi:MAG: Fpg/Nei family DNA glycosylase [Solirubrobacterales bacterium]|nr:Fpg/Nei family DNA glycosylase [Solirubrobacterales bacterium]
MPEGDTIAYAAVRIRPVLEGRVPDEIVTPHPRHALDRWPSRLHGRAVSSVDTHGKHLFLRFEGDLVLHSHLGMIGMWGVYGPGRSGSRPSRSPRRAWIVFRAADHEVVEFDGPLLELMTEGRTRFDQRLAALGPDVLADEFDFDRFLRRMRSDDPTRPLGDALLDQRNVAGIGNIWKAEGCWEAGVDPWRRLGSVTDDEVVAIIVATRPRMMRSATMGHREIKPQVYGLAGRPCPRCRARIVARGQGDANRTTYWCPGCQS